MIMKTIMKWALVLVGCFAVMAVMFLMSLLIGGVLTPVLGMAVAKIIMDCFTVAAAALYFYGVIRFIGWLAEYGYFE